MGISMSLDLSSATLADLAAFVDAAQGAGVVPDTALRLDGSVLTIDFGTVVPPVEEPAALRDQVRQIVNEEAVRGLFDTLITKNSQRRP